LTNWYLLKVDLKFAWGWSIRTPTTSAAEMSLLFPPPSTLIGALARGLSHASKERWTECISDPKRRFLKSSAVRLLAFIASAHFGLDTNSTGITPWSDITHSYAVPYQQIQHRSKREMWFGVHAIGKIYSPNSLSHIIYVVNGSKAENLLGKDWKEQLKMAAYSITAVGGKEGLTVTYRAEVSKAMLVKDESIRTLYCFPERAAVDYTPQNLSKEEFWDHTEASPHWSGRSRSQSKRIPYILPIDKIALSPAVIEARPSSEGVSLTIDGSTENTILLLKEWLSNVS